VAKLDDAEFHAPPLKNKQGASLLSQIPMRKRILNRENLLALFICLLAILLLIVTTDSAPQWIYQGF